MEKLGLDPETETPGREVVRHIGESLVEAMDMALENAQERDAAQVVACECVVLAETKDHLNWELIHEVAEKGRASSGMRSRPLTSRWRNRKTSTSTTRPAGAESCGSSHWACPPCCRRLKRRRK
jgi:hypothetical protein